MSTLISFAISAMGSESQPINEAQLKAYKKVLETSACAYVMKSHLKVSPTIIRVPSSCSSNGNEVYRYECSGRVLCANRAIRAFTIEKAVCWSKDGLSCPPAQECAMVSFADSLGQDSDWSHIPLLKQSMRRGAQ